MRYKITVEALTDSYKQEISFAAYLQLDNHVRTLAYGIPKGATFLSMHRPVFFGGEWPREPVKFSAPHPTAAEAVQAVQTAIAPYLEFSRAWLARVKQAEAEAESASSPAWISL